MTAKELGKTFGTALARWTCAALLFVCAAVAAQHGAGPGHIVVGLLVGLGVPVVLLQVDRWQQRRRPC